MNKRKTCSCHLLIVSYSFALSCLRMQLLQFWDWSYQYLWTHFHIWNRKKYGTAQIFQKYFQRYCHLILTKIFLLSVLLQILRIDLIYSINIPPHLLRLAWQCYKLKVNVLAAWRWGYHSCYQSYLLQPSVVFTDPMRTTNQFPLHPAPLQYLASCRRQCVSSTTFTKKERSPAHSLTFLKYSVLFVGVLRGNQKMWPLSFSVPFILMSLIFALIYIIRMNWSRICLEVETSKWLTVSEHGN